MAPQTPLPRGQAAQGLSRRALQFVRSTLSSLVSLREIRPADIAVFYEHQLEPEATAMAAFPARDLIAHNTHWGKVLANPTVTARAILVEGKVAGQIGSWEEDGQRLVGYWLGRAFWGKGVATAALQEFLKVDPQRPLRAHVATHNHGSIRVLEKCGFSRAGVERGVSIRGGPPVDELIMELAAQVP